ncbi:hypothetical protein V8E36_009377 [Tilletia maclaganii]
MNEEDDKEPENLNTLVENVLECAPGMKLTLGLAQRVAIWRRTGYQDGCKSADGEWNKKFWSQTDKRLRQWIQDAKDGSEGDQQAAEAAEDYINNIMDEDEIRFGDSELPTDDSRCDVQQTYAAVLSNDG